MTWFWNVFGAILGAFAAFTFIAIAIGAIFGAGKKELEDAEKEKLRKAKESESGRKELP